MESLSSSTTMTGTVADEMTIHETGTTLKHSEPSSAIDGGNDTDADTVILTPKNSPRNDSGGSPERPAAVGSPEPNCAICLGKLENKSFTDSCFHQFCFTCLVEWSKVKAECPLCKQSFKSIVHNVRSIEDYDQYHLQTEHFGGEGGSGGTGGRRFRYRSTMTSERRRELALGRLLLGRHMTLSSDTESWSPPQQPARPSPYTTSEFRRYIYENELWARSSCRAARYREAAPNFYATNPAVTHRLVPWLNRELNALRYGHQVAYLLELIMSLIERFHIRSPEFREHIRPYFLDETDHFVHEFFSFARSPHDMVEYDRLVTYEPASLAESSNRDVMTNRIVPPPPPSSASDDVVVVYSSEDANRHRELVGIQPVVVTRARLFLDLVSESRDSHAGPSTSGSSPIAGPSGIQNRRRAVKQEVTIEDDDDDVDDDCMIVGVVKSSNLNAPEVIIDISDHEVDDGDGNKDDVIVSISSTPSTSTTTMRDLKRRSSSSSDDADSDSDEDVTTRSSGSEWTPNETRCETHSRHEPKSHKRHKSKHRHHHHHHHHHKHKSNKSSRPSASESSSSEKHKRKHHKHKINGKKD